jgi:predicted Zn-dependent protease
LVAGESVQRALRLKREGQLEEAVIALESLLAVSPGDPFALAHLAHAQLLRQRPAEALSHAERAEAAGGATSFTARLRGDALYRLRRPAAAAAAYAEAVALGESGTWSLVQLGRSRLRLGHLETARHAAGEAAEREPSDAAGWALLGDIAVRAGDADEALAMYERAHAAEPGNQYAYARMIEFRLRRLPADQRAQELEVVLRSRGRGNPHLTAVQARLQSELGDQSAAAAAWRQSRQGRDDLYAQKMEGYALRKAGKLDQAARVLRESLLRDPQDVILFRTYVRLEKERGALHDLRDALTELLPVAGDRRGAVYGELRKLGAE